MSFVLDNIRLKEIISEPQTVNVTWVSPSVSLDDRENEFSISVFYENGAAVDMVLSLQFSADNINFGEVTESLKAITDSSGTHMWDVAGSGAPYARVKIEVNAGSIDVTRIFYSAKQRH